MQARKPAGNAIAKHLRSGSSLITARPWRIRLLRQLRENSQGPIWRWAVSALGLVRKMISLPCVWMAQMASLSLFGLPTRLVRRRFSSI